MLINILKSFKLLLDHGADVNAQGGEAFVTAINSGKNRVRKAVAGNRKL